jgi:hypothetical protein
MEHRKHRVQLLIPKQKKGWGERAAAHSQLDSQIDRIVYGIPKINI